MRFPFFGTDPRQQRIDELAYDNISLNEALVEAQRKNRELDGLANQYRIQRDAARIERDTAQRERDEYRERLLRFTAPRERGPGGRFMKAGTGFPIPGSAADVSPPTHRTIS